MAYALKIWMIGKSFISGFYVDRYNFTMGLMLHTLWQEVVDLAGIAYEVSYPLQQQSLYSLSLLRLMPAILLL